MFCLFVIHMWMNRKWYKAIFRGKYSPRRVLQTIINLLLVVVMFAQPISGVLMSKYLFTFIDTSSSPAAARVVHLFLGYWGFVLMSIHAGTHLNAIINRLNSANPKSGRVVTGIWILISIYGCVAFAKRNFLPYLLLIDTFVFYDYSEPFVLFLLDYIAIMILFMFVGRTASKYLR